ncbi:ABC transporter ATP-binding protein [Leucobacter chromiireducens subsp. solipictus]|uniref:ABC transporter ATP-binding protein n=1 Tax=Leucobacter chromiireducens subsp. solipictus TaxID=398235 RepID=A0ABS1SC10_9MICO|nr:ABC transporter ATP-binding protein [Leucobacter chromiireducens subsp. solipictus]
MHAPPNPAPPSPSAVPSHTGDVSRVPWLLRAEGIAKSYGPTVALAPADFTVAPGESVAIMGPSGSGKSTLLLVLSGILTADTGSVILRRSDDAGFDDLAGQSDAQRSAIRLHRFGFVFQQGMLIPELTATENVMVPLLLAGVQRRLAQPRAERELDQLGLSELGERRIGQLSGGQAQRVAVARALVTGPSIVFADEPTGALDSHTAEEVLDTLLGTAWGTGPEPRRAVVLVTHSAEIAARCDRIVRVRDGRIEDPA